MISCPVCLTLPEQSYVDMAACSCGRFVYISSGPRPQPLWIFEFMLLQPDGSLEQQLPFSSSNRIIPESERSKFVEVTIRQAIILSILDS